jgi:hypothetical protein
MSFTASAQASRAHGLPCVAGRTLSGPRSPVVTPSRLVFLKIGSAISVLSSTRILFFLLKKGGSDAVRTQTIPQVSGCRHYRYYEQRSGESPVIIMPYSGPVRV